MNYTEQTADSIRYCLLEGNIDHSQFTILKTKKILWNDLELNLHILGESHFIQFVSQNDILNEICPCTDFVTSPKEKVIFNDLLPNIEKESISAEYSGYAYTFHSEYHNWEEGMQLLNECILKEAQNDEVIESSYIFPTTDGESVLPITQVFITTNEDLGVHTFHTYPNEKIIVFTSSKITKKVV